MNNIIIIPAFNPPKSFIKFIEHLLNITEEKILIIDDGSVPQIKLSNTPRLSLLRNKVNMGKGYSLKKGFAFSIENDFTHCVTIDADSQHDPIFVKNFFKIDANISLVIGNREFDNSMPFHRKVSNQLTSKLISILTSHNLLDSQCGFRRYRLEDVQNYNYLENGFQFESEIIITLLKNNHTLSHLKISTIYGNEKSFINNFTDTLKFIRLIIRYFFKSLVSYFILL